MDLCGVVIENANVTAPQCGLMRRFRLRMGDVGLRLLGRHRNAFGSLRNLLSPRTTTRMVPAPTASLQLSMQK
jgi:hypothetical protein